MNIVKYPKRMFENHMLKLRSYLPGTNEHWRLETPLFFAIVFIVCTAIHPMGY